MGYDIRKFDDVYGHMEGHEFRFIDALIEWAIREDAQTLLRLFSSDKKRRIARRFARALTQGKRS